MSDDPLDPTGLAQRSAGTRGHERDLRGHGAATDHEAMAAFRRATRTRHEASAATALYLGPPKPRGYTRADHERAEALRGEAASLRRIAAAKRDEWSQRLVEREAANLEADAEAIVPLAHARQGWR